MLWSLITNCIKITSADFESSKGKGFISTLTFGPDITDDPVASSNPMAPTYRGLGRSARCILIACGSMLKM